MKQPTENVAALTAPNRITTAWGGGVGKTTLVALLGQTGQTRRTDSAIRTAVSTTHEAEIGPDEYDELLSDPDLGKIIIHFVRLRALDLATQIMNHLQEHDRSFGVQFAQVTQPIAIHEIADLQSLNHERKATYNGFRIRIRVEGTFVALADPQAFLVTMVIEGLCAVDGGYDYWPVFGETIGTVPLNQSVDPSVAPDIAGRVG